MGHGRQPEVYALLLARFHAQPTSYKALILSVNLQLEICNEKGATRVEEEKFRLPVDVRGSKTAELKLSIVTKSLPREISITRKQC